MTDADKVMNPQHFGSDPAGFRIRIRINLEIQIRLLDHLLLRLDVLAEVCALCQSTVFLLLVVATRGQSNFKKRLTGGPFPGYRSPQGVEICTIEFLG